MSAAKFSRCQQLLLAGGLALGATAAQAIYLPASGYLLYGDALTYSLPSLAVAYNTANGGGTGPGNPYYVDSTPGAIKDLIVVYTGANGQPVNTNFAGMDNAFAAPNGTVPYFATADGADPDGAGEFSGDLIGSWDSTLASLQSFQGGKPLVFYFNNNDTNEDQNLAIWARAWVTNSAGQTVGSTFCMSNTGQAYAFPSLPADPRFNGNPAAFTCSGAEAAGTPSVNTASGNTDYLLSGGEVWIDANGMPVAPGSAGATRINHNLGANQAAYAAVVPELDLLLASLYGNATLDMTQYALHIDLKLGCDAAWTPGLSSNKDRAASTLCDTRKIDNGYEQLFIGTLDPLPPPPPPRVVPEPSPTWLLGLALLLLAMHLQGRLPALANRRR